MPIMMLPRWPSFTSLLPHLQVMHLTLIHSHIIVEFNIVLWTDEFLEINQSHGILFSARKEVWICISGFRYLLYLLFLSLFCLFWERNFITWDLWVSYRIVSWKYFWEGTRKEGNQIQCLIFPVYTVP
jgi:hypothetical protein